MSGLRLTIDRDRWNDHLQSRLRPGLVPVVKGNGYGFGVERLVAEARRLGVSTVAVGTAAEVKVALRGFDGDVVMMMPYFHDDPRAREIVEDPRVVVTVGHVVELERLAERGARVLVEVRTSMQRHGLPPGQLDVVRRFLDSVDFAGWTIHLPMGANGEEAEQLGRGARGVVDAPLWFSHLSDDDHDRVHDALGGETRLRRGTDLWLGDRGALSVTAQVLDVHKIVRGQPVGYHRRPAPGNGWVVVVAGGTAHGIGLEAPSANRGLRDRVKTMAVGALDAAGRALSPYEIDGRKRAFLEPPHMQSSMVFLPANATPPAIGAEVPTTVRNTIAVFDEVVER